MSLITTRIKAEDIGLPKWAKKALEERGLKENEVEVYRKGISPEDTKINKGERSTVDYITTKVVDRDGDIVVPKGAVLDHYRKNPVVLFAHNYNELPVGKSLWIKADDKGLIAKTQYAKHQKADEIYQYRKDGFPMAKSIGFIPLSVIEEKDFGEVDLETLDLTQEDIKGASRIYPEWLMLEYSDVPVPSNPEALQLAISKGIITAEEVEEAGTRKAIVLNIIEDSEEEKEVVHKPETTENYHHIPIRDKGDFVDDSFRTITLSEDQGIKAVIGKLKSDPDGSTHTQKFLFDVNKWSMEEAQSWVNDHKELEAEDRKDMLDKRYGEGVVLEILTSGEDIAKTIEKASVEPPIELDSHWPKFTKVEDVTERWNKSLSKEFDVESLETQPSTVMYDIASKWLDCKVRDMYVHSRSVPSAMMGNFLSGLEYALSEFDLITSRNFENNGSESPLTYEVIQLTADDSKDFLIDGMGFYEKDDTKLIIRRYPTYFGIEICAFSTFDKSEKSTKVFSDTEKWIKENNLLKGQKFSLSGEFLKKSDDTWDSLFLKEDNHKAIKTTVDLLNKRKEELKNRGIILMGPPGTGKTLSGRVMMNDADSTFIWVSARDFIYAGSVGGITYGFRLARQLAPSILFIEDVDHWLDKWACDLMKTEMDGIAQHKGVVTALTSNYPEMLPPALIDRPGRFHDVLNFDLPDAGIRMKMLKSWAPTVKEKTVSDIVDETVGFSGAHMYELVEFAKNISEEEEIDIDSALLVSLNKIKDQRELISALKKEVVSLPFTYIEDDKNISTSDTISWSVTTDSHSDEYIKGLEEKAGRVLSKKTRGIISDALLAMEKATIALNELVDTADSKDSEEPLEDVQLDEEVIDEKNVITIIEKEEEKPQLINVDENKLKKSIADAFADILRGSKLSVGDMVKESLDRRNGKIF